MATENVRLFALISIAKSAEAAKEFLIKCRRDHPDLKRALDIMRGDLEMQARKLDEYGFKTGSFAREVNEATLLSELYDLADRLQLMATHLMPAAAAPKTPDRQPAPATPADA